MTVESTLGLVYRCPVCDAEIIVATECRGAFRPRCCNTDMQIQWQRVTFYRCSVCGSQIAVLTDAPESFEPRCCNEPMELKAA